jgi:predicted transcriptional regulator of viral defense system
MDNATALLYKSSKTIFTTEDLALLWQETNKNNLKAKISYYAKKGSLLRLTRGVFAKDKNYNPKELATSLYIPSYISFETVLRESGMIFQHYETTFAAGSWSKTRKIDGRAFTFRKMKKSLLFNPSGIISRDNYGIASPERAFLDTIYLFPKYYFDSLKPINWNKCRKLAKIYANSALIKRLEEYHEKYA